ncbi:MAG: hypothetical protein AAF333_18955 [Planctomycetota bacterium]
MADLPLPKFNRPRPDEYMHRAIPKQAELRRRRVVGIVIAVALVLLILGAATGVY